MTTHAPPEKTQNPNGKQLSQHNGHKSLTGQSLHENLFFGKFLASSAMTDYFDRTDITMATSNKKKPLGKKLKNFKERATRIIWRLVIVIFIAHIVQVVALKWMFPPLTLTQFNAVLEGHTFERANVPISKISPNLMLAVISSEDQLFAQHNGFDLDSISTAIAHNQKGKSIRGASTISQQTAKNVFLWQGRSWLRKGLEAYYTFLIETLYGKKRILELYLNVAEMGPGIFGAEAAARNWFHKSAAQLTPEEAARIAACLPNPKQYNPASPSAHTRKKARWILTQMAYLKTRPHTSLLMSQFR